MAIANVPRMNALLSSAPPTLAGVASATNNAGLATHYQAAFTTGLTQMMLISAIGLFFAAILSWFWLCSYQNGQNNQLLHQFDTFVVYAFNYINAELMQN